MVSISIFSQSERRYENKVISKLKRVLLLVNS